MKQNIVSQVMADIEEAKASARQNGSRLRTPVVRDISKRRYQAVKGEKKEQIFATCEELLEAKDVGARLVAFDWAFRRREEYVEKDFKRFERWLVLYVDGWDSCDDFCVHAFGSFIYRFPEWLPEVKVWTQEANQWMRRGSAVVLIYAARRGKLHAEAFETADLLLVDEADLVQKGYGWLLKEVSNLAPEPVFEYVMLNKERMPRTALRYAVEKLEPDLRRQAMAKDWA